MTNSAVFIFDPKFVDDWQRLGHDGDDLRAPESVLLAAPTAAPVMASTGGLRKIRFADRRSGKGKSGGTRVCFAWFPNVSVFYVVLAFGKKDQANLTASQCTLIRGFLRGIAQKLEDGSYG